MERASRSTRVRQQVTAVAVAVVVSAAGLGSVAAQELPVTSASSGGVSTNTAEPTVNTGDIITGENTGHVVMTGDTADGDVSIVIGDMSSTTQQTIVASTGPQIGDASGGNYGAAGPGAASPPISIDIKSNPKSKSDSTATGGAGGAGGAGGNATGGAGGAGGNASGGTAGEGGAAGSNGSGGSGQDGNGGTP